MNTDSNFWRDHVTVIPVTLPPKKNTELTAHDAAAAKVDACQLALVVALEKAKAAEAAHVKATTAALIAEAALGEAQYALMDAEDEYAALSGFDSEGSARPAGAYGEGGDFDTDEFRAAAAAAASDELGVL